MFRAYQVIILKDLFAHKVAIIDPFLRSEASEQVVALYNMNLVQCAPKPSLKIRTANAILWISLGIRQKIYFLGIFFFLKIKCWNFQHLFEIKFCETSQNFNSFSLLRQLLFSSVVWLSWNFVRIHKILSQTDYESFSFL